MNIMEKLIDYFETDLSLFHGKSIPEATILDAETRLGLNFSEEYKDYLKKYGIAVFSGHELTGLGCSARTNVIDVTLEQRKQFPDIPINLYVVEETNYDGCIIWQNVDGTVYVSDTFGRLKKVGDSLAHLYYPEN